MNSTSDNNNTPQRILCVGMCVLDIVHVCTSFPEEDTDRRCLKGYWQRGGNASNNCTVLRNLGTDCEFLGMLSESGAFQFLLDDCRKRGIHIENCPLTSQDPPFSSVVLSQESDSRTIIHSNSNFPILTFDHFQQVNLANYSWIHFEGRNPEETLQMMKRIQKFNSDNNAGIKISLELEKIKEELLVLVELADYVFLGKELAIFLGWNDGSAALKGLREKYANGKQNGLICTWGSEGSWCLTEAGECHHLKPYPPSQIVDALGAGDTFCAAVIYGLDRKRWSLDKAVDFGNRVAGFKLGHCGYDAINGSNFKNV